MALIEGFQIGVECVRVVGELVGTSTPASAVDGDAAASQRPSLEVA